MLPTQSLSIPVTDTIRLERIDGHHAAPLFALIKAHSKYLRKWLPWVDDMQTEEDCVAYIKQCKQQHMAGTDYGYIIISNGTMVGRIGVHYIHTTNKSGAIGYWLAEEFQGKGIITKAAKTLIQHCFTNLPLNRIEIKCATGNHKSAAIAERLHFKKEGVLRQAEWVNEKFVDLNLYALLKTEWKKT